MEYESLDRALRFAARRHQGQRRDGDHPLPYLTHPVEVLTNLRFVGGVTSEPDLCAAILHDVLEETDTTAEEIERRFGSEVSKLVLGLTRLEPTDKETEGMSKSEIWALRSSILLQEIENMSKREQTIKLADRLANIRDGKRTKRGEKLARYLRQTEEILRIISRDVNPGLWDAIQAELLAQTA